MDIPIKLVISLKKLLRRGKARYYKNVIKIGAEESLFCASQVLPLLQAKKR